ncbi:hypothetical protein V3C33_03225 [Micrococcaceae bacterium Sec5.7]
MIEILQWSTLIACGLVTVGRIPSALRNENRSLFCIFSLMTLAILLSIQAPYVAIDQLLGGINLANLVLRFVIFAAIFFVGLRVTRGFSAPEGQRLITGRTGMVVLALISVIMVVLFFMMDTAGSSAGLKAVSAKDQRNGVLVEYYGAGGRAYPAYVSLVMLPAMVRAVRGTLPLLIRVAALLLAIGGVAITLTLLFPFVPPQWGGAEFIINYTAILCFVAGLALIWLARVRAARTRGPKKSFSEN